ncbi:MAG: hypothetical protein Kow0031_01100 [Anaerolineae bacterium]
MEYIPLQAAAKKYGIEEKILSQLISAGMIDTKSVSGGILVAVEKNGNVKQVDEQPQTKEEIIAAKFAHLQGKPITLSEAAEKYDVSLSAVKSWLYRNNYISPMFDDSHPAYFDEAQIAYLAEIYHERQKTGSRAPLLTPEGLPYKIKLPGLARYRREKKVTNK